MSPHPGVTEVAQVKFIAVGPSKKTWTTKGPIPLTYDAFYKEVKRMRGLGSRSIDFDESNGGIYVGMFRRVGSFVILSEVM